MCVLENSKIILSLIYKKIKNNVISYKDNVKNRACKKYFIINMVNNNNVKILYQYTRLGFNKPLYEQTN